MSNNFLHSEQHQKKGHGKRENTVGSRFQTINMGYFFDAQ
jgi:hypothetical protein